MNYQVCEPLTPEEYDALKASIAATGVDFVSIGGLTKHVAAIDLSMRIEFVADDAPQAI